MTLGADDDTCRAAAYHESAHLVIACVAGLPIHPKGISIDGFANGRTHFKGSTDNTAVSSEDVDNVVIALLAGGLAHCRMHGNVKAAVSGDEQRIAEILETHIADPAARQEKREQLRAHAKDMVDEHWQTIENLAQALWSKSWQPRYPHRHLLKEKALTGIEIAPIVVPLPVVLDDTVE
jgi:hypothetical protein